MNYTREELFKHSGELLELIEDIVEYYCDENRISGELAYSIVVGILTNLHKHKQHSVNYHQIKYVA